MLFLIFTVVLGGSPVSETYESGDVRIKGSISQSLRKVVGKDGAALAAQTARLLRWKGDVIRNVQPNDRLSILHAPDTEGQPQLVAMVYSGSEISLQAYRFPDEDGIARYYDEYGQMIEPALKKNPVPAWVQITEIVQSGRGKRRHRGLDFKAPIGTPIILPWDAKITRVNWSTRRNGQCVEARFGNKNIALFLHLDKIDPKTRPGAWLKAGDQIGTVGNTGRSTAAHLHYEMHSADAKLLDPIKVHGTYTARVHDSEAFRRHKRKLQTALREMTGVTVDIPTGGPVR